jgi:hypothetical protein
MFLFECLREFLIADLKFYPSFVEGKSFSLSRKCTLSLAIDGMGPDQVPTALIASSRHPPPAPPTRAPSTERSSDGASGQPERAPTVH